MAGPDYSRQTPDPEYPLNRPLHEFGRDPVDNPFGTPKINHTDDRELHWPSISRAYHDPDYLIPTQMQKDQNALEAALNPTGEHRPSSQGPFDPIASAHYPSGLPYGHVPPEDAFGEDDLAKYPYPVPKPRNTQSDLPREFPFKERVVPPPGIKIPNRLQGPFNDNRFKDMTPRQR